MKRLISILLFGICISSQVFAGYVINAKVILVRADQSGLGMVVFDKLVNGSPACINAAAYTNALSFNSNTAGGKAIMTMALTAKATGATIEAYGTGACGNYGGAHVEDWSYGVMQ
jgi:hypothetical protein